MVILERDLPLQRMVSYNRAVVPSVSVSAHRRRFSHEAELQVLLAAPIAQENGFVFTIPFYKSSTNLSLEKNIQE